MRQKFVVMTMLLFLFVGIAGAAQPKILELEDNFGNTYEFDTDEGISSVSSDQKITLKDDTELTFCITEIEKDEADTVEYSFESYLNNPRSSGTEKCHTWNLDRSDITATNWFDAQITNGDEIGWADYGEIDHIARVSYQIEVAEDDSETTTETHKNRLISESRYEELTQAEEELEQKNQTINELEQQVQSLQQNVSDLREKLQDMNQSETLTGGSGESNTSGDIEEQSSGSQRQDKGGGVFGFIGELFG